MGLFDKLFGSAGNDVLKQIKEAAESVAKEASDAINNVTNQSSSSSSNASKPQTGSAATIQPTQADESGDSWGPEMPEEENQFNSGKTYQQYFMDVYRETFPEYDLAQEAIRNGSATLITFTKMGSKALVVELMPGTSEAQSIRRKCISEGTPYLRFYYNHEGWWNTKSYVVRRTKEALKL
ncbi:MAG: hypothetical protein IJL09_00640 [Lachnospiraceae bacterium]|nr:hypothetical protein [Lachnospiraceae bacterium]MBQ6093884.1 hypothetical protein [Lachnospiraceae bacterium]